MSKTIFSRIRMSVRIFVLEEEKSFNYMKPMPAKPKTLNVT